MCEFSGRQGNDSLFTFPKVTYENEGRTRQNKKKKVPGQFVTNVDKLDSGFIHSRITVPSKLELVKSFRKMITDFINPLPRISFSHRFLGGSFGWKKVIKLSVL